MRGGIFLIIIGILMAYLGVSGKYKCFTLFAKCVGGDGNCSCQESQNAAVATTGKASIEVGLSLPKLPSLPTLPSIKGIYG